uniref:Uncharacterized protein n=1 Tax=Arundo donax TaxID=35708 RepID=A0A0A9AL68_ARUDO
MSLLLVLLVKKSMH